MQKPRPPDVPRSPEILLRRRGQLGEWQNHRRRDRYRESAPSRLESKWRIVPVEREPGPRRGHVPPVGRCTGTKVSSSQLRERTGEGRTCSGFVRPPPGDRASFDPDADADGWGVSLARRDVFRDDHGTVYRTENVELVCLDTCRGGPRVDYRYRPSDADQDAKIGLDGQWPYSKMRAYLLANWRTFVDEVRSYRADR